MNAKLLTDEALRDDLYIEMMFMAGSMAIYGIRGDTARGMIEEQLNLLMPVVKRHIKRHVKVARGAETSAK